MHLFMKVIVLIK